MNLPHFMLNITIMKGEGRIVHVYALCSLATLPGPRRCLLLESICLSVRETFHLIIPHPGSNFLPIERSTQMTHKSSAPAAE